MAPFNQRQIGYIQAIAGRQQHVTLICGSHDGQIQSNSGSGSTSMCSAAQKPQALDFDKVLFSQNDPTGSSSDVDAKSLFMYHWNLDHNELGFDSREKQNNDKLEPQDFENMRDVGYGFSGNKILNVFDAACEGSYAFSHLDSNGNRIASTQSATGQLEANTHRVDSTKRATPDGFLNSTDIKFRFTLPADQDAPLDSNHPLGQNHYEFRWIVWRSKKPTLHRSADDDADHSNLNAIRDGVSFRNPLYDFFMGQTGRKRGLLGYTLNPNLDSDHFTASGTPSEVYCGKRYDESGNFSFTSVPETTKQRQLFPTGEKGLTVDDLLTMRINRDDYVVMKDVRFFLGKEHGKSHFEDHLHWDWNDPIETIHENVLTSPTLNDKNYRWHCTLIGTSGGKTPVLLNHQVRWTTKMESG